MVAGWEVTCVIGCKLRWSIHLLPDWLLHEMAIGPQCMPTDAAPEALRPQSFRARKTSDKKFIIRLHSQNDSSIVPL